MGNQGWARYYKTNSHNIFQTQGDYVEQAVPDRMEFFKTGPKENCWDFLEMWRRWGSNPRPFGLESSTESLHSPSLIIF